MMQRCSNPKHPSYKDYGARGVTVHDRYRDFELFLKDLGPRPADNLTLERRDNSKGYEPGNVYWASRKIQQRNRRTNRLLTFEGKTKTLVEWCEEKGIEYGTLQSRLRYGWSVKDALTKPMVKSGRPRRRPKQFS